MRLDRQAAAGEGGLDASRHQVGPFLDVLPRHLDDEPPILARPVPLLHVAEPVVVGGVSVPPIDLYSYQNFQPGEIKEPAPAGNRMFSDWWRCVDCAQEPGHAALQDRWDATDSADPAGIEHGPQLPYPTSA